MSSINQRNYEVKSYCELHRYDHEKLKIETGNPQTDNMVRQQIQMRGIAIEQYFSPHISDTQLTVLMDTINAINDNICRLLGI
jgi:hypothetical protein